MLNLVKLFRCGQLNLTVKICLAVSAYSFCDIA